MKNVFSISANEKVRVWNKFMHNTYELISKRESTLQDGGIGSNQVRYSFIHLLFMDKVFKNILLY